MNILLIGERFSPNLGDGVIYDSVESICKKIYGQQVNLICLDISGGTTYKKTEKTVSFKEKIKTRLFLVRKILSEVKRTNAVRKKMNSLDLNSLDGAIFVGGQLFSEYFSKPIYVISKMLEQYNVPIVFNCCGIGKNEKKKNIGYLCKTFSFKNVIAISVRDNYEEFIKKYGLTSEKVQITMDPVIEYSKFIKIEKKDEKIFGIGVMDPKLYMKNGIKYSDQYYVELYRNIIRNLNDRNINWEFFCNGRINDYDYAKRICTALNISNDKIAERPTNPEKLVKLINRYSNLISFRLHSHIIAYSYNIPSIGFGWDNKVQHFFDSINKKEYVLVLDNNINDNFNKIINKFINETESKQYNHKLSSVFLQENKFGG